MSTSLPKAYFREQERRGGALSESRGAMSRILRALLDVRALIAFLHLCGMIDRRPSTVEPTCGERRPRARDASGTRDRTLSNHGDLGCA